jgi:hypothetical protein
MSTYGRATQSQSVTGKKQKTCSSRWIILCTPLCATVARDRLPDAEADGQTATPGIQLPPGATLRRGCVRHLLMRTTVVEAIIVVPSLTRADLYALLQCGKDSEYGHKAYGGYIKMFWAEDGESSPSTSGNFQSANAWWRESDESRWINSIRGESEALPPVESIDLPGGGSIEGNGRIRGLEKIT